MEQALRTNRDKALTLLRENRGQAREGIEALVRDRLVAILTAANPNGGELSPENAGALYDELLDLSFVIFSLGYSVANLGPKSAKR